MLEMINGDYLTNTIKPNSIDLVIADPPYGINYAKWDKIDFPVFTRQWVENAVDRLKDTGTMWVFMAKDNLFTHKGCKEGLVNILQDYGEVHLENWVCVARQKGRGASKHLKSTREEIIHFTKTKKYTWNNLQVLREVICPYVKDGRPRGWFLDEATGQRVRWTGLGNNWPMSFPQWNGKLDLQRHSCQKPILLYERLIKLSSNKGDLILDPFAGSFASAIAAKLFERDYIGYEKDLDIYTENSKYVAENFEKVKKVYEMEGYMHPLEPSKSVTKSLKENL